MKYDRFEQLPAWQQAAQLAADLFAWTARPAFRGKGDLANQLQRAALSISNNIAEGFERGTTNDLLTFLYYARGSAGEVRSMLCVMQRMPAFAALDADIETHRQSAEAIARQIRAWADFLQNSPIQGQKYLTDAARTRFHQENSQQAFLQKIDNIVAESRTRRAAASNPKEEDE